MAQQPRGPGRDEPSAWPLGCGVALLGLLLSFNLAWLFGLFFAAAVLPPGLERLGPLLASLVVPLMMLVGWAFARRRNPYGGRVLLWGIAFSLMFLVALTALFDAVNRLNGL